MEQSPWEANSSSASQDIPPFYGTRNVHYRIHKSPQTLLSWATSIQSMLPSQVLKINFNIVPIYA
jgi:hypothetical protein